MKKLTFFILSLILLSSCDQKNAQTISESSSLRSTIADTTDATNDFYDNAETFLLPLGAIRLEGEIENPGMVDFSKLPIHSVIVKETLLSENGDQFVGAYRYDGFALYDILNLAILNKKNKEEFNPIIDLFVQIENEEGDKVNISWGELFYPNHLNEIIIANRVMRIVPSKTKNLWPLPEMRKLVVKSDLITERNILNPSKITIKSYPKSFVTVKGLKPLDSPKIDFYIENKKVDSYTDYPKDLPLVTYNTIFYGRGRGIHSTQPFNGVKLKDVLSKHLELNQKNIREGLFVVAAKDGYRGVFTFSEVMNRNDQSEILLIYRPESIEDGIFQLFPACDFFSDRAIKGINEIYFSVSEQ